MSQDERIGPGGKDQRAFPGVGGRLGLPPEVLAIVGRMKQVVLAGALAVAGCRGPEMTLGYGTLTEDHGAQNVVGCGADERTSRNYRGMTVLSAQQHSVSRRLDADGEVRATFEFDVNPEVTGDVGTLTLTANARVENDRCGTGCEGASGRVQFVWSGAVSLPPAAQGYAVRVVVHGERATSMGVQRFQGECTVETPWRVPIVAESGDSIREFDAPSGDALVRVGCDRMPTTQFVSLGCYGAPTSLPPMDQGFDDWSAVLLRVQIRFARRAD